MAFEIRPNSGNIFTNRKKEKDTHPDVQGDMVMGADLVAELARLVNAGKPAKFRVAGWKKTTKSGDKFISLSISSADFKGSGKATPTRSSGSADSDPF